jgi:hypothetical protein
MLVQQSQSVHQAAVRAFRSHPWSTAKKEKSATCAGIAETKAVALETLGISRHGAQHQVHELATCLIEHADRVEVSAFNDAHKRDRPLHRRIASQGAENVVGVNTVCELEHLPPSGERMCETRGLGQKGKGHSTGRSCGTQARSEINQLDRQISNKEVQETALTLSFTRAMVVFGAILSTTDDSPSFM